ncbi:hypothetical protein [Nesterenkonia ebinurensis]|nr:hypothetical protein [Nesterenkonia ebinurensis]
MSEHTNLVSRQGQRAHIRASDGDRDAASALTRYYLEPGKK